MSKSSLFNRSNSQKKKKLVAHDYMDEPAQIDYLLPSAGGGTLKEVAESNYDMNDNSGIRLLEDKAFGGTCIELYKDSQLHFDVKSTKNMLVLFIKHINRFCELHIEMKQDDGALAAFILSNNQSVTRIDRDVENGGGTCTLPMILQPGWNYLNINLETLLSSAFGTKFGSTVSVTLVAECIVSRIFLQDRAYSDVELPDDLRISSLS
eukprot:g3162.t1